MVASPLRVVGIDCACRENGVGLAVGSLADGRLAVEALSVGRGDRSMQDAFAADLRAILEAAPAAVLALDAPLGWPAPLARALGGHRAGDRLGDTGDVDHYVFRRTDEVVFEHVRKWPLDVGANYIARTAFAALELVAALREGGRPMPMLWHPGVPEASGVIEVYPAATLLARGLSVKAYKSERTGENEPARRVLLAALGAELSIPAALHPRMIASDHALDAVACLLAAKDFVEGLVVQPAEAERDLAEREGWIWFRRPIAARVP